MTTAMPALTDSSPRAVTRESVHEILGTSIKHRRYQDLVEQCARIDTHVHAYHEANQKILGIGFVHVYPTMDGYSAVVHDLTVAVSFPKGKIHIEEQLLCELVNSAIRASARQIRLHDVRAHIARTSMLRRNGFRSTGEKSWIREIPRAKRLNV